MRLSVLDVSPVTSGSTAAEALQNTLDLARLADRLGYTRYWLAEHHNSALIASSVPEIMIGHVAGVTERIRVGSGGVMLPNHSPLHVAESFRMLEALHPGRIDLGLGRAPGTDGLTALALRRSREALGANDFPEQLADLLGFLDDTLPDDHPYRRISASPAGVDVRVIYLLGSSDFSAEAAGAMGLGFAFAHHINPGPAREALRLYRANFRPSTRFAAPAPLVALSVICADTDEEADRLAASADLAMLGFHIGRFGPLPSLVEAAAYPYASFEREIIRGNRERLFVGSPDSLKARLTRFAETMGVEELVITTLVHQHAARRHSYELLAEAFGLESAIVPAKNRVLPA
jgi:luciferase family oxidoreductase group 1